MMRAGIPLLVAVMLAAGVAAPAAQEAVVEEDFTSLEHWEPLEFPKIDRHTEYTIAASEEAEAGGSVLEAVSGSSASGLVFESTFDTSETPVLEWRWKIEHTIPGGNALSKEGDDYAARIYVIFPYDPEEVSFAEKLKYKTARLLYGEYPPLASLNYIWANREHEEAFLPSVYSSRSMMFVMEEGDAHSGTWRTYRVNIREDYRRAFGEEAPNQASLALMSDTDNTGSEATAYFDYIRLLAE